ERALAMRRMVIAKMQTPPDEEGYAARLRNYRDSDALVVQEADAARKLINAIIEDESTPSAHAALGRIDAKIESALNELRRELIEEDAKLLRQLEAKDVAAARETLTHVDAL